MNGPVLRLPEKLRSPLDFMAVMGIFSCLMGLILAVFMPFEPETAAKEWYLVPLAWLVGGALLAPKILSHEGEKRGFVLFLSPQEASKAVIHTSLALPLPGAGAGSLRPTAVAPPTSDRESSPPRRRYWGWVLGTLAATSLPFAIDGSAMALSVLGLCCLWAVVLAAVKAWKTLRLAFSGLKD